jgi:hypothetical protein
MHSIKTLILNSGGIARFSDLWEASVGVVQKWSSAARRPNRYALLLFNAFDSLEEAQAYIEARDISKSHATEAERKTGDLTQ